MTKAERVQYDRLCRELRLLQEREQERTALLGDFLDAVDEIAFCRASGQPVSERTLDELLATYRRAREA